MSASESNGGGDRIERIELFHVDVPLPTPFFPLWIRGYPQHNLRCTLVILTTRDGLVGAATGAAFDRERSGLGEFIGPFLLGLDPYDLDEVAERLEQATILGWRNSWIETAFWDLAAQARGVPLHQLIAERTGLPLKAEAPRALPAYASFGEYRVPEARAEATERARRLGFGSVKIGLDGASEHDDLAVVRAARQAGGPELEILVHAYQARRISLVERHPRWTVRRAEAFAAAAAELGVAWLQEPLSEGLAELAGRSPIPIVGGDVAQSWLELEALIERSHYRVLTPDVTFSGPTAIVRTLRALAAKGMGFSPRSFSDGVALLSNLHALAAWSRLEASRGPIRLEFPWEPPAMLPPLRDALFERPLEIDASGAVQVPTGPGLGIALDPRALRRYAQRFYTLTPVRFVVSSARRSGLVETSAFVEPRRRAARRHRRAP